MRGSNRDMKLSLRHKMNFGRTNRKQLVLKCSITMLFRGLFFFYYQGAMTPGNRERGEGGKEHTYMRTVDFSYTVPTDVVSTER